MICYSDLFYGKLPNLIIGFHGCEKSTFDSIINNRQKMHKSSNKYDWLGNGMYFWEQNLERAWQWAKENKKIKEPAVIGAVIELGYCLNLLDSFYIQMVKNEYTLLKQDVEIAGDTLPENKLKDDTGNVFLRNLDCAVLEHLHSTREKNGYSPFDSVRGVFWEGEPIYHNTEIREKNHIQICIRNPNCIKGYFVPLQYTDNW